VRFSGYWGIVLLFLSGSCASQSRLAKSVTVPIDVDRQGANAVAYPPPPAQVEVLPAAPSDSNCVWVDGQWAYKVQEFEWSPGAWVKRPLGCEFAHSRLWWEKVGPGAARLFYRPGRWVTTAFPHSDCRAPAPCITSDFTASP
jgi:hypothetical protein